MQNCDGFYVATSKPQNPSKPPCLAAQPSHKHVPPNMPRTRCLAMCRRRLQFSLHHWDWRQNNTLQILYAGGIRLMENLGHGSLCAWCPASLSAHLWQRRSPHLSSDDGWPSVEKGPTNDVTSIQQERLIQIDNGSKYLTPILGWLDIFVNDIIYLFCLIYSYLSVCLPACLPACLSIYLSVYLSVCLSIYLILSYLSNILSI